MDLSDYGKSISVECTENDLAKLMKIQKSFDKCMENARKTKEQLLREAVVGPRVY